MLSRTVDVKLQYEKEFVENEVFKAMDETGVHGANDTAKEDIFLVEMLGRVSEEMVQYDTEDEDEWFTPRNEEDFAFEFDEANSQAVIYTIVIY